MKLTDRIDHLAHTYYERSRDLNEQWLKMPEGEQARITLGRSRTAAALREDLSYITDTWTETRPRILKLRLAALLSNYQEYKAIALTTAADPHRYQLNELGGWQAQGNALEFEEIIPAIRRLLGQKPSEASVSSSR